MAWVRTVQPGDADGEILEGYKKLFGEHPQGRTANVISSTSIRPRTMVAMLATLFLSLIGFYLVRGTVERDRRTGVGQILAATPLRGATYILGKAASNFVYLTMVVGLLAGAAAVFR